MGAVTTRNNHALRAALSAQLSIDKGISMLPVVITDQSQRWRNHVMTWRPTHDGGFDASRYSVVPTQQAIAKRFVTDHHYSGSYPAANFRFALLDRDNDDAVVGVAVFGNPAGPNVLTAAFPTLAPYTESTELSRFVLLDEVPSNAETWFLARSFEHLRERNIKGVLSFSDPVGRSDLFGNIIFPGHIGRIYTAKGGIYTGRSGASKTILLADGTVFHARARSKVIHGEPGTSGVEARLIEYGARRRQPGQDGREWLADALLDIGARVMSSPGNHRYCFAVGSPAERRQLLGHLGHDRHEAPTRQIIAVPTRALTREDVVGNRPVRLPASIAPQLDFA